MWTLPARFGQAVLACLRLHLTIFSAYVAKRQAHGGRNAARYVEKTEKSGTQTVANTPKARKRSTRATLTNPGEEIVN